MANLKSYVEYLNTLHNANAGNSGAIAETQIKNSYYKEIEVQRNISNKIFEILKKENIVLILTGHAGDGKTALLSQVLEKTGNFEKGQILKKKGNLKLENKNIYYLKDFSEFNRTEQYESLIEAIENTNMNGSSILVTNVGPLMDNLKRYYKEQNIDADDAEDEILNTIDSNKENYLEINGEKRKILIFNIGRINNTSFIPLFIDKILNENLWRDEDYSESLHYKNFDLLLKNKERVKMVIQNFYEWLYENNQRSTIRQMIAHLTYSLTGNMDVESSNKFDFAINNFGQFFFGYKENNIDRNSLQIDSIKKIQSLKLDEKNFHIDYECFIEENFKNIDDEILNYYKNRVFSEMSLEEFKRIRKSFRRGYIFFSSDKVEYVLKDIFGKTFLEYLKMKKTGEESEGFDDTIFSGLYKLFTGQPLEHNPKSKIYITLRREGNFVQNVQLIQGEIKRKDIRIVLEDNENQFVDKEYDIYLKIKGSKGEKIKLKYPIIKYFIELEKGAVKTDIDPHLSNGIDSIKSKLGSIFAYEEEEL
ncbi:MAG: hypothetical protein ACRC0V_10830, partial [Fusobacteriaceae bacterium]